MGGGGKAPPPDPNVGIAARENAAIAREQLEFTKQFFRDYLLPQMQSEEARADRAQAQADEQFALNMARERLFDERYRALGIPAEDRYFQMVADYSAPEEEERQARLAIGDVINAAQVQQQGLRRQFAAMGIDPTSPAAISAATDASVLNAASAAAAANRARDAARQLGMALTSDAANFGRGLPANIAAFSQLASGNNAQGFAFGQQPFQNAMSAGGFVQSGYGMANQAFGQNLNAAVSDSNTRLGIGAQLSAANSQGLGSAIGAGVGLAALAALAFSDRRMKEDIQKVGKLANGLPVYLFRYKGDPTPRLGLMAQDVEKKIPEAVVETPGGIKAVRYDLAARSKERK